METEDIRQKFDAYDQRLLEHDRQLGDLHREGYSRKLQGIHAIEIANIERRIASLTLLTAVASEEVWDATLDARTRPEHAMLDQQVKDEEHGGWYVPRLSKYVSAPLHSGDPSFDLNCRCRVTARVKYLNEGDGRRLSYDDWVVDQWSREPELKDKGMERSIQRYQIEKMRLYPENLRIDKENKMGRYGLDPAKTGHAIPVLGAFGIRNDEAGRDYLDSLIRENISKSDIKYTGNIEQGRKYNSILHLKDQNGAEVDLLVSWIYNTYKDPKYGSDTRAAHMTTFYIKK